MKEIKVNTALAIVLIAFAASTLMTTTVPQAVFASGQGGHSCFEFQGENLCSSGGGGLGQGGAGAGGKSEGFACTGTDEDPFMACTTSNTVGGGGGGQGGAGSGGLGGFCTEIDGTPICETDPGGGGGGVGGGSN